MNKIEINDLSFLIKMLVSNFSIETINSSKKYISKTNSKNFNSYLNFIQYISLKNINNFSNFYKDLILFSKDDDIIKRNISNLFLSEIERKNNRRNNG